MTRGQEKFLPFVELFVLLLIVVPAAYYVWIHPGWHKPALIVAGLVAAYMAVFVYSLGTMAGVADKDSEQNFREFENLKGGSNFESKKTSMNRISLIR